MIKFAVAALVVLSIMLGTSAQNSTTSLKVYDQCGGSGGNCRNYTCANDVFPSARCPNNTACLRQNSFYWQCLPCASNTSCASTPAPPAAPRGANVLSLFDQCGGRGANCSRFSCVNAVFPNATCEAGTVCRQQNEFYWQCLPCATPAECGAAPAPSPASSPAAGPAPVPIPAATSSPASSPSPAGSPRPASPSPAAASSPSPASASSSSPSPSTSTYLSTADLATSAAPGGRARVMYNFTFSSSKGLQLLNPYLAPSDYAGVPSGSSCTNKDLHCYEKVSLFSGLAPSPRSTPSELRMIGITDRGPNGDCAKSSDKSFPVPSFSPSIFELRANKLTGAIEMVSNCYLKDSTGAPITGLPNIESHDDVPQGLDPKNATCIAPSLANVTGWSRWSPSKYYDVRGIDWEDVQAIPGTNLCIGAEEYAPSVFIFNCDFANPSACGTMVVRYVPKGSPYKDGNGIKYVPVLPEVFYQRRANRGLENVAISPDGKTAVTFMQSPMGKSTNSSVVHSAVLDISDVQAPKLTAVYLYLGEDKAEWKDSFKPADLKLSATSWAAQLCPNVDRNRPIMIIDERASKQVKVFLVDLSKATNVLPTLNSKPGNETYFDNLWGNTYAGGVAALQAANVTPIKKVMAFDTGLIGNSTNVTNWSGTDKQEGILMLNDCTLAIGDDNDFGLGLTGPVKLEVVQLAECISSLCAKL